jgi:hypothetical protein
MRSNFFLVCKYQKGRASFIRRFRGLQRDSHFFGSVFSKYWQLTDRPAPEKFLYLFFAQKEKGYICSASRQGADGENQITN